MNSLRKKRILKVVSVIAWIAFLSLPVAFFFAPPGAIWPNGPEAHLFASAAELLGERKARLMFCGALLAIQLALFWRLVLSKHRAEVSMDPVDLHD